MGSFPFILYFRFVTMNLLPFKSLCVFLLPQGIESHLFASGVSGANVSLLPDGVLCGRDELNQESLGKALK